MAQVGFDRRRINGPEESFPPVYDDDEMPQAKSKYERDRPKTAIRPICAFCQPKIQIIS